MDKHNYQKGQIVWTKIKGFPWWPAIIARVYDEKIDEDNNKLEFLVNFIGDNSHAKVTQEKIWDYDEKFKEFSKQGKSKKLIHSIKLAAMIKNGGTTYEEESTKLKEESQKLQVLKILRKTSHSKKLNISNLKLRKKRKIEQLESNPIIKKNNDKILNESMENENETEFENSLKSEISFHEITKKTRNKSRKIDNLDELLFSGEYERISRSKAKELNIEHKLRAPIELDNKGIIKKSTQKIRDKFMKKTISQVRDKIRDVHIQEQISFENWETKLEQLLTFLINAFNKPDANDEEEIKKELMKIEQIITNCNKTKFFLSLDSFSKTPKLFKALSFVLKCFESNNIIQDQMFLISVSQKINEILITIKNKILESTFDIKEYITRLAPSNNISTKEEELSFQESEKSLSTPPQYFSSNHDEIKSNPISVSNYFPSQIFSNSPEKTIKPPEALLKNRNEDMNIITDRSSVETKNNISKPSLRKKICLKLAKSFEINFGIEKSKAQQLTLQFEAKIRMKYPTMENDYKNLIKGFIRFLKINNKLSADDLKNIVNADFEKIQGKINFREEKINKSKKFNLKKKSVTTSPMTVSFHKK